MVMANMVVEAACFLAKTALSTALAIWELRNEGSRAGSGAFLEVLRGVAAASQGC